MRPVEKYPTGANVTVYGVNQTVQPDYSYYRDAKDLLQTNLGKYCSYCEAPERLQRDIHVEHVQPKGLPQYAHLETAWSNFLLACSTCNGADNKDTKDVVLTDVHLPHRNNTFLSLKYCPCGAVKVNPSLQGVSRIHAENLWRLVGFDKLPSQYRSTDTRWRNRMEAWNIASKYRARYDANEVDVDVIVDLAKAYGYWSVWFTVFDGCDAVKEALIYQFPGTSIRCFDSSNHFNPVERNQGNSDPV